MMIILEPWSMLGYVREPDWWPENPIRVPRPNVQSPGICPANSKETPVSDNIAIQNPTQLSVTLARDERQYMARWLALEVLMTDEDVCADADLYDKLSRLQETWEEETLARYKQHPPVAV
jgi:hypothetical protein